MANVTNMAKLIVFSELYKEAQRECDALKMADCLLQSVDDLCACKDDKYKFMLAGHHVLLYAAVYYLRVGNSGKSIECLNVYGRFVETFACGFSYEYFALGARLCHNMEDYDQAIAFLSRFCESICVDDEAALFFGSLLCHQGQYEQGREKFLEILAKHPSHPEAAINLSLVDAFLASRTKAGLAIDYLQHLYYGLRKADVKVPTGDSWRDVPIIINSRDRLGCLKQLLAWLLDAGYRRIYILDNGSSYKPLLEYYAWIEQDARVDVVRLANMGHIALWEADILYRLGIDNMFVYTDSDVVPVEACPHDVVRQLAELLFRYPDIDKAGLGIVTDDITLDRENVRDSEAKFYQIPLEKDVWFAHVDTTFALHRPRCSYRMMKSIRTTGNLMIRHLPWYLDKNNLPEDEQYYVEHANYSSTTAGYLRAHK